MRFVTGSILLVVTLAPGVESAAQGTAVPAGDRQPMPALRAQIYEALSEAQACAERSDLGCAEARITELEQREDLSSYERAQTANFDAYIQFEKDDMPATIAAYERLLAEPDVPRALRHSTQYSLATLYTREEQYDEALARLEQWWPEADPVLPDPYVLKSQIYYQLEDPTSGLATLEQGLALASERGIEPQEGWIQLKNVFLYQLEDYAGVVGALEDLIEHWPSDDYYEQLAGMRSLLGDRESGLAAVEAGLEHAAREGLEPSEKMHRLEVSLLRDLGDLDAVADALESMIRIWPKQEYYAELAKLMGALGNDERRLQLLEASYASGWLETSDELVAFAELLLDSDRAGKARDVLERGLEQGRVEDGEAVRALLERATSASERSASALL